MYVYTHINTYVVSCFTPKPLGQNLFKAPLNDQCSSSASCGSTAGGGFTYAAGFTQQIKAHMCVVEKIFIIIRLRYWFFCFSVE